MSTVKHVKVQYAYHYFKENIGKDINLANVANCTGWKVSTVQTYYNKKWKGLILNRRAPGKYAVIMDKNMSLADFGSLHTQVHEGVS